MARTKPQPKRKKKKMVVLFKTNWNLDNESYVKLRLYE